MASVLKVDEMQGVTSAGNITITTGSATMRLQEGVTKHWVNYDAVNSVVDGSFNQSSLTDHTTGDFTTLFTNNFSSASDKCHFASALNSTDDGDSRVAGDTRCGVNANMGHLVSNTTATPLSTSQVDFFTGFGSDASAHGDNDDLSASYCMTIGDLA